MNEQRPDHQTETAAAGSDARERRHVLRDVVLFQLKLFVDGLRDLVLVPVSLIAALIDLLIPGNQGGQHFYEVVRIGRRSERWIRLFSAVDHLDDHPHETDPQTIDQIVTRVERKLKDQYGRRNDS